jgi:hypothetical protein
MTSALALGLALAGGAAQADVQVTGSLEKDKDIFVTIDVTKTKDVNINVTYDEDLVSAAEALAISNQVNTGNTVSAFEGPIDVDLEDDTTEFGIRLAARIQDSINNNVGLVGVNQDVGNANNQGNTVAVAALVSEESGASFTHSESSAEQINTDNLTQQIEQFDVEDPAEVDPIADAQKRAVLRNSVNENAGIITVNQSAGNMNNQSNNIALAVGIGSILALSEADLGQTNSGNLVEEVNTVKLGLIENAVNNNTGVIAGNQTSGNMNNQGNSISFSALTTTAALSVPGS